jgi:hypothetical protein
MLILHLACLQLVIMSIFSLHRINLRRLSNELTQKFHLKPIEDEVQDIQNVLLAELSLIPNQIEYLIEESFPYDSYTFLDELEKG